MKPVDIRKQIKSGDTGPLYLLEGDDPQSRHDLAMEFDALVDEGLHAFNVHHLYANEATSAGARDTLIAELLSSARTLPMMSPRRVIAVYEVRRHAVSSPRVKAATPKSVAVGCEGCQLAPSAPTADSTAMVPPLSSARVSR